MCRIRGNNTLFWQAGYALFAARIVSPSSATCLLQSPSRLKLLYTICALELRAVLMFLCPQEQSENRTLLNSFADCYLTNRTIAQKGKSLSVLNVNTSNNLFAPLAISIMFAVPLDLPSQNTTTASHLSSISLLRIIPALLPNLFQSAG